MDYEEDDDYDDYMSEDDSDDSSWRVRRYAIFIIETLIQTNSNLMQMIFTRCLDP